MLDLILFLLLMLLVVVLFILIEFGDLSNKIKTEQKFAGGRGTREKPFLIDSIDQLHRVRNNLDKHFRLTADINLKNYCELRKFNGGWQPIGTRNNKFSGSFDGQGYIISNMFIESDEQKCLGLFACSGPRAVLQNINLQNICVSGKGRAGGVVGRNEGLVKCCKVSGKVEGDEKEGLIVGENVGRVENC